MKWLFDSLTAILHSAQPSVFAFVETTLPYMTPIPIATISSISANTFFGLSGFPAFAFVYSLEAIGLVATTKLVDMLVEAIRSRNVKSWLVVVVLIITMIAYIRILVSMNVTIHSNYGKTEAQVLTLICYLPLMAGVLNGVGLMKLQSQSQAQTALSMEETHRQQERADRKEFEYKKIEARKELEVKKMEMQVEIEKARASQSLPLPLPPPQTFPQEVAGDYKQVVFDILDQNNGNVGLTDITRLINEAHGTHFVHDKVKGTWFKFKEKWAIKRNGNPAP